MGGKPVKPQVVSPAPSADSMLEPLICDPCMNLDKPAYGWCGTCCVYLCQLCSSAHPRSHRVATGHHMPTTRPTPRSIFNNDIIKQIIPIRTLRDVVMKEDDTIPQTDKNIVGCTIVEGHIVTISYLKMMLYDSDFDYVGQLNFVGCNPNSICSSTNKVISSFSPVSERLGVEPVSHKNPNFYNVQVYVFKPAGCTAAKLSKVKGIKTEGDCFCVTVLASYTKYLTLAVGMKLDEERHFVQYLVQIIKENGSVLQSLEFNPRGEPCFTEKFFMSGTRKPGEIVVSLVKEKLIRGIDICLGKTLYEFDGGNPQGVTVDEDDNIYVYNNSAMYWIPASRAQINYMVQSVGKKGTRQELRMASSLALDNSMGMLYLTNIDKDTIEVFKIN